MRIQPLSCSTRKFFHALAVLAVRMVMGALMERNVVVVIAVGEFDMGMCVHGQTFERRHM